MPAPIDPTKIIGKKFGRGTVRELTKERDKFKRRVWLLDCECGGVYKATTLGLQSGHKQSCGCLQRESRLKHARPFVKAEAKREHDAKKKIRIKGKLCYAPRLACEFTGLSYSTLEKYATEGAPWLGGKKISTELGKSAYGREIRYFVKRGLVRLRKAMKERLEDPETIPDYPGLTYIHDACAELSCSQKTLHRRMAAQNPPVEIVKKPGVSADDRPRPLAYVPTSFVTAEKLRRFPTLGEDDVTVPQVAKLLRCSKSQVHVLIDEGILTATETEIANGYEQVRNGVRTLNHGVRTGFILSKAQVKEVKKNGTWPPVPKLVGVRWKGADELAKELGISDPWKRLEINEYLQATRDSDPTIATRDWYQNRNGHWRRKWKYDTERVWSTLTAKKQDPVVRAKSVQPGGAYPGHARRPHRAGPVPNAERELILQFCYDRYVKAKETMGQVLAEATEFGGRFVPESKDDVKKYAKIWANRFDPPLPSREGVD
jgi:hypothetical protein